jgi:hypothetical protein
MVAPGAGVCEATGLLGRDCLGHVWAQWESRRLFFGGLNGAGFCSPMMSPLPSESPMCLIAWVTGRQGFAKISELQVHLSLPLSSTSQVK